MKLYQFSQLPDILTKWLIQWGGNEHVFCIAQETVFVKFKMVERWLVKDLSYIFTALEIWLDYFQDLCKHCRRFVCALKSRISWDVITFNFRFNFACILNVEVFAKLKSSSHFNNDDHTLILIAWNLVSGTVSLRLRTITSCQFVYLSNRLTLGVRCFPQTSKCSS